MDFKSAAHFLRGRDDFLLITHDRPDGDTIGSAAALCRGLRQLGKKAYMLYNPGLLSYCAPCAEGLYADTGFVPETLVAVDIADTKLFFEEAGKYEDCIDLCIDHHPSNTGYAKNTLLSPASAAVGEIIFVLLGELGVKIDRQIAEAIYIAIVTDTGCFAFSNTSPETHRITAELMETGIDAAYFNKVIFRTKTKAKIEIERTMYENLEYFREGRVAVSSLNAEQIESFGASGIDVDGISSLPIDIEGVRVGITIRQENGGCKISLRSSEEVDASKVCRALGGGGHARAAGCFVEGDLKAARDLVLKALFEGFPDV